MAVEKMRLFLGPEKKHEEDNARAEEIAKGLARIPNIEIDIVETKGVPLFEKGWPTCFPSISIKSEPECTFGGGQASGIESIKKLLKLRKVVSAEKDVTLE